MMASPDVETRTLPRGSAGFSLLEILVVLTIIGLLMSFSAVAVSRYRETGRITDCTARIQGLSLLAESYAEREGRYPPDRLVDLGIRNVGNAINEGIESCVAALRRRDYGGGRPAEKHLGNTDDDSGERLESLDGSSALLELLDPWDNPLIYIVNDHYHDQTMVLLDDGGGSLSAVAAKAMNNPLTGAFHCFESFQIRSAGPDGLMDTEDDLGNFETDRH
ncbi:MAG: prepilin-type N-terminal cleavage/methylation domain-containing protein [Pseudohongiellaceae bacterium]|jgi:prepilin-type N-terminal cleavage/methylation domain-containing protein